ncbi:hypothetical protein ACFL3T_03510 [Patescibacteria group bacterium]
MARKKQTTEAEIPWKEVDKTRLTSNISVKAMEKLNFARYITREKIGKIISDLINANLEEVPQELLKVVRANRAEKAKKNQ